jgi:pimeloyl-ACP methyl ester carboxylesterase
LQAERDVPDPARAADSPGAAGVVADSCPAWVGVGEPGQRDSARVTTGSGSTAIVLAHESDDNACAWGFFVPQLAAEGRQVLAFDFSGKGQSDYVGDGRLDFDVLAAVNQVRKQARPRWS